MLTFFFRKFIHYQTFWKNANLNFVVTELIKSIFSNNKWKNIKYWEIGLPEANSNLRMKFKENKIQKNFEFCLSFEFVLSSLHFPLLRTLKVNFYILKYFLNFVLETLKIISNMLKYFLTFVLGTLKNIFYMLKYFLFEKP